MSTKPAAGQNDEAIVRLRKGISSGQLKAHSFYSLATGAIRPASQKALTELLHDLCGLEDGTAVALEIFHMATYCLKSDGFEVDGVLLDVGHQVLLRTDYKNKQDAGEYQVQETIKVCYSGLEGEIGARELCHLLKTKIAAYEVYAFQLDYVFDALFEVQPVIALDEFLLGNEADDDPLYESIDVSRQSPLEKIDPAVLWSWADQAPDVRYPLISRSLNVFVTKNYDDNGLSPLFLEGLEKAPDTAIFLKSNTYSMSPSSWSGNLSVILDRRREYLSILADHADREVRSWVAEQMSNLRQWADYWRERETESEETFE